jgi:hypothetical protein
VDCEISRIDSPHCIRSGNDLYRRSIVADRVEGFAKARSQCLDADADTVFGVEQKRLVRPARRARCLLGRIVFTEGPLTTPSEIGEGTGVSFAGDGPEILDLPDRTILTATFTKHQSVLSSSEFSIYTEATLHVDEVFEAQSDSGRPIPHQDVTLLLPGGSVLLRSGRTLSYKVTPADMSLEPGHKYLLVLVHHRNGDFYTLADDWGISDGVVRPNTHRALLFSESGRSELSGLKASDISAGLSKDLYGQTH